MVNTQKCIIRKCFLQSLSTSLKHLCVEHFWIELYPNSKEMIEKIDVIQARESNIENIISEVRNSSVLSGQVPIIKDRKRYKKFISEG